MKKKNEENEVLIKVWLMQYRTYITPFQLLTKLIERYQTPNIYQNLKEPLNSPHSLLVKSWYNINFRLEVKRKVF